MTIAVLVPTYGRAHAIPTVVANVGATAGTAHEIYFVAEHDDEATLRAVAASGRRLIVNRGARTYEACINLAFRETSEPFLFVGADDLHFCPNWLVLACAGMADPAVGVVGCHDPLHQLSDHATHYLVRRAYVDRRGGADDLEGHILGPYAHNFTDWELVCTAKVRGAYRFAEGAVVNHIHPGWTSDGRVRPDSPLFDATYAKGNVHLDRDTRLFLDRSRLWEEALRRRPGRSRADDHILRFLRRARHPRRTAWSEFIARRRLVRSVRKRWRSVRGWLERPAAASRP